MSYNQILSTEPQNAEQLAALKAEKSRQRREHNTMRNLVLSLIASAGVMLVLFFLVVRPESSLIPKVDYATTAQQAQEAVSEQLAVPVVPDGWTVNAARFDGASGDAVGWYLGFVTADNTFIAFEQGIGGDDVWTSRTLDGVAPTGSVQIAGLTWVEYDRRDSTNDTGNLAYAISTAYAEGQLVLYGTGDDAEFETLARNVLASLGAAE